MTYTVAIVDEGLLDITNYKTPDPHSAFYAREALGVDRCVLADPERVGRVGVALLRPLPHRRVGLGIVDAAEQRDVGRPGSDQRTTFTIGWLDRAR